MPDLFVEGEERLPLPPVQERQTDAHDGVVQRVQQRRQIADIPAGALLVEQRAGRVGAIERRIAERAAPESALQLAPVGVIDQRTLAPPRGLFSFR